MLSETNLEKYDLSENMIPETQTQSNSTPPLVLTFSAFQISYKIGWICWDQVAAFRHQPHKYFPLFEGHNKLFDVNIQFGKNNIKIELFMEFLNRQQK